jgi:hypothetical protein
MEEIRGSKKIKYLSLRQNRFFIRGVSREQISRINSSLTNVLNLEHKWNKLKEKIKSKKILEKKEEIKNEKIKRHHSYCYGIKIDSNKLNFQISTRKIINDINIENLKNLNSELLKKKTSKKKITNLVKKPSEKNYLDIFKEKIRLRFEKEKPIPNEEKKTLVKTHHLEPEVNLFDNEKTNLFQSEYIPKNDLKLPFPIGFPEHNQIIDNISPIRKYVSHKVSINSIHIRSKSPKLFPKINMEMSNTSLLSQTHKKDQLQILKKNINKKDYKTKVVKKTIKISQQEKAKIEIEKISKMNSENLKVFFKNEFFRLQKILVTLDVEKNVDLKPQIDMMKKQFNIIIKKTTNNK